MLDDAGFRALFSGSPIKRIGRDRFVRNVLIAAGNSGDAALAARCRDLLDDASPLVRGAAVWALSRLVEHGEFLALAAWHTRTRRLGARGVACGRLDSGGNGFRMTSRFFIFGAGYSGKAFAAARQDAAIAIAGTTRSPDKFDALRRAGIEPLVFDGQALSPELLASLKQATHLVVSIAPDDGGDPAHALLAGSIASLAPHLRWIGYLSTVGVYGDHDGDWVDETAECRPVSRRSVLRVEAEKQWLALGRTDRPARRHAAAVRHLRSRPQCLRQSRRAARPSG